MELERIALWKQISDEVRTYADELLKIYQQVRLEVLNEAPNSYLHFSSADADEISFSGDETWNYGGYEHYRLDMPASLLECSAEQAAEHFRAAAIAEKARRDAKADRDREAKEASERRTLEALKNKYEATPRG